MLNDALRREVLAMREEDFRVRSELMALGELGGSYVTRMEEVHVRNAARLRELIAEHGWPAEDIAGQDGAEAAWLIAQHAVGDPDLQHKALSLTQTAAAEGRLPAWHAAYLEDRIAMHENRPQRYGTQWLDDPIDGLIRPWTLAEPDQVDEFRAEIGLKPLHAIPPPGPPLPTEERRRIEDIHQWWEAWFAAKGWKRQIP